MKIFGEKSGFNQPRRLGIPEPKDQQVHVITDVKTTKQDRLKFSKNLTASWLNQQEMIRASGTPKLKTVNLSDF